MLDRARELGLRVSVTDDGHFHRRRSVSTLVETLNGWNELVAGLGAALRAVMPADVHASGGLTGRPDLERLEARGLDRFKRLSAFLRRLPRPPGGDAP